MRGKKVSRLVALLMAATFVLSGCGSSNVEVPELLEPKAVMDSYRTVQYGSIGATDSILYGVVVPTEYGHFWATTVKVSEIKVDIGDTVSVGDVLAVADIDSINEAIDSINSEISLAQSIKSEEDKKYELKKQELEYKLLGCQETGDNDGVTSTTTELSILAENHNYDELLYQHRVSNMNERIAEQQKVLSDGALTARVSGRVSYVKDLSNDNQVTGAENIVVIADYDNCYIEVMDKTVNDKPLKQYPICYTTVGGKKYDLVAYPYLDTEMLVIQSRSQYPPLRLKFADESVTPEAGSSVPIMLQKTMIDDVLVIGNDTLYNDEKGTFVYVRRDNKKEVQYIEIGTADKYNAEVISGLSEGDQVYYSSDSVLPDDYVEYKVEISQYVARRYTDSYSFQDTQKLRYYSDYEGQIVEMHCGDGTDVSKGDLLCTIKTNEGSAALKEMSNAISSVKSGYESTVKAYDEQIKDLESQLADALLNKNKPAEPEEDDNTNVATATDAATEVGNETNPDTKEEETKAPDPYLYEELNCQIEQLKIDKKMAELNYNYSLKNMEQAYTKASCNNDGTGTMLIYADYSGRVTNLSAKAGKKVKIGDKLFNIEIPANKKVALKLGQSLALNQPVQFTEAKSGKVHNGRVSGNAGFVSGKKYYVSTIDDKVYITESLVGGSTERYYITMEDETFFDTENKCNVGYSDIVIDNTIVFPKGIVYSETNVKNPSEELYYLFKIVDGEIVKQYVNAIYNIVNNEITYCVLGGLKEDDVVARDRASIKEDSEE